MKEYNLLFQGYTWDDYFYVISAKQGVLVAYSGSLDSEGTVLMNEILYVSGAKQLSEIYESNDLKNVRKRLKTGDKLFFSYAETQDYLEAADGLIYFLRPKYNKEIVMSCNLFLVCEGSCALFPNKIIKT